MGISNILSRPILMYKEKDEWIRYDNFVLSLLIDKTGGTLPTDEEIHEMFNATRCELLWTYADESIIFS